MKIVIVHHYVKEGCMPAAQARIAGVSARMLAQPGCEFRQAGILKGEPTCLTTVTAWQTPEHFAAWLEIAHAGHGAHDTSAADYPYVRVEQSEVDA